MIDNIINCQKINQKIDFLGPNLNKKLTTYEKIGMARHESNSFVNCSGNRMTSKKLDLLKFLIRGIFWSVRVNNIKC